jgi:hypothetical protein
MTKTGFILLMVFLMSVSALVAITGCVLDMLAYYNVAFYMVVIGMAVCFASCLIGTVTIWLDIFFDK